MMAKTILACLFLASVVTAIPSADNVVPETDTDFGMELIDAESLHEEARGDVADLLQAGKTKDACASLADSTAKEVADSVASAQKLVNSVPKGSACKQEGQQAVNSAKTALDKATSKATSSKKAADAAKAKPVKFKDVTIAEIKAGDCSAFFADPAFTSAKKAAESAAAADAKAQGELKSAKTAHDNALAAQKAAIRACACHTKYLHNQAKVAADKSNSAANAKAWSKAHMMKCVLDGKTASNCKVPATPKVTMPALEAPASTEKGCSAPTPPPTPAPLCCDRGQKASTKAGWTNVDMKKSGKCGSGMTLTGGGMKQSYGWGYGKLTAIERFYPTGNTYQCDTGFGAGHLTCWGVFCNLGGKALQCQTKSKRVNRKAHSGTAQLDAGYVMTGGGIVTHYGTWDKHSQFERSEPHGNNGWISDMGFGWGDFTSYVRGCKGLTCKTVQSGVADAPSAQCPKGYTVTGCGMRNHYGGFDKLSLFEDMMPDMSYNGCRCNMGEGAGKDSCFARCCK